MDVVKKAVIEAGGKIDVATTEGEGTIFTISIPRNASTQIIDGYIVRSFTDEVYVLPLANVIEAFSIDSGEITEVAGRGKLITRRDQVYPVFSINSLLDPAYTLDSHINKVHMGVLIDVKGRKSVIQVKEIEGIQKIVCKQIEGKFLNSDLFEGAAIAGNGNVSMIININSLLETS
jgi:two-component system chemotaxis sensor kinase CheA